MTWLLFDSVLSVTGNRCKHLGYDDFDPASWNSECAPNTEDWIHVPEITNGDRTCGTEKSRYPEVNDLKRLAHRRSASWLFFLLC